MALPVYMESNSREKKEMGGEMVIVAGLVVGTWCSLFHLKGTIMMHLSNALSSVAISRTKRREDGCPLSVSTKRLWQNFATNCLANALLDGSGKEWNGQWGCCYWNVSSGVGRNQTVA